MSAWIRIYCKRALSQVTPDNIMAGIAQADLWTLAEMYGIDESLVEPALDCLEIESVGQEGFDVYDLHYRESRQRPIRIDRWTTTETVEKELAETKESLENIQGKDVARVVQHLEQAIETVGIELGFNQLEDMGTVIAYEVARWLAKAGDGIVRFHDDSWWKVGASGNLVRLIYQG